MNKFVFVLSFSILPLTVFCKEEKPAETLEEHKPAVSAFLKSDKLTIAVTVPANHHAYLDAGKEGVYIPIAVDWKDAISRKLIGATPRSVAAPEGIQDKEIGASLLRGKGDFVYEGSFDKLAGQSLKVRSQICDDIKGVCYRPTTQEIQVKNL